MFGYHRYDIVKWNNNVCYINSLRTSGSFQIKDLADDKFKKDTNKIMTNEYYDVIKNLWNADSEEKAYSPNSFKDVLAVIL